MTDETRFLIDSLVEQLTLMAVEEYGLSEAVVFGNDNIRVDGGVIYAPVYMVMFLAKNFEAPLYYKVDLSGLC